MGRYDDVRDFLDEHSRKSKRTILPTAEVEKLRKTYPGIPDDFVDYLSEIGWGSFLECRYMVYDGFVDLESIFDAKTAATFSKRVVCFGDNFSGDLGGFLPDESWKVIEIWHDSMEIYDPGQSFEEFIRDLILMDDDGNNPRDVED